MFNLTNFFKAIAEYFSKPKTNTNTSTNTTTTTTTYPTTNTGTNPYTPPTAPSVPSTPTTGTDYTNVPPAQTFPTATTTTENTQGSAMTTPTEPEKTDNHTELLMEFEKFAKEMNAKKVRTVTEIAVHCTATKEGKNFTVADIDRWHKDAGFTKQKISGHYCGYHYVVALDGTIMKGRDLRETGAHTSGHNSNSIGVCYVGGLDGNGKAKDTRTPKQKESLLWLIANLKRYLNIKKVQGHRDYPNVNKACPCFNAIPEYQNV